VKRTTSAFAPARRASSVTVAVAGAFLLLAGVGLAAQSSSPMAPVATSQGAPMAVSPSAAGLSPSGSSQGMTSAQTLGDSVSLSVRFYDKRIYYPESEIPLMVTIANTGDTTYRFKLADDRIYSLSVEARTPSNRLLDASDAYKLALGQSRPVLYRELALKPGEEYSFMEQVERYVHIDGPGSYAVSILFYPELVGSGGPQAVRSNVLLLNVRPSPGLPPGRDMISQETGEVLKAQALPPDEVVRRTIVARQKGLWNQFFLYLDLEALLTRDPDQKTIYNRQSDEGRRLMLQRFRDDLQSNVVDKDIVVQPYYFEVLETRYTAGRGVVRVLEKFQDQQLRLIKEYSYELERRDDVWYIVGYTVLNKGAE